MHWRQAAIGLIGLIALTGCAGQPTAAPSTPAPSPPMNYVALGDSYTAAPYVVNTDLAQGCLRSHSNYPRLVAKELKAKLTDVSCGGARTVDVAGPQRTLGSAMVPAQLDAVTRDADLITIGLGGNDGGLFSRFSLTCPITGPDGRRFGDGNRCGHLGGFAAQSLFQNTRTGLTRMLRTVKAKAPEAQVLLIGYPRLLGEAGCKVLPVAKADLTAARHVAVQLQQAQRAAAEDAGVGFIDMHALSRGHDACSSQAWVNGVHTDQHKGAALHPNLAGQQAVAAQIERAVADHQSGQGS